LAPKLEGPQRHCGKFKGPLRRPAWNSSLPTRQRGPESDLRTLNPKSLNGRREGVGKRAGGSKHYRITKRTQFLQCTINSRTAKRASLTVGRPRLVQTYCSQPQ